MGIPRSRRSPECEASLWDRATVTTAGRHNTVASQAKHGVENKTDET